MQTNLTGSDTCLRELCQLAEELDKKRAENALLNVVGSRKGEAWEELHSLDLYHYMPYDVWELRSLLSPLQRGKVPRRRPLTWEQQDLICAVVRALQTKLYDEVHEAIERILRLAEDENE